MTYSINLITVNTTGWIWITLLISSLFLLYVQVTVHRDNLCINNQQDASSVQNFYFVTKLYMFRASTVPIIVSYQLYTWQLVSFMQVMWPLQLITPDDGHSRCPKHVEFRDKIKILDSWCTLLVIYMKVLTDVWTATTTSACGVLSACLTWSSA
jgi:hypothetical protein